MNKKVLVLLSALCLGATVGCSRDDTTSSTESISTSSVLVYEEINGDSALELLNDIVEKSEEAYNDVKSFTIISKTEAEEDGEEYSLESEVKYDHDRKAIYVNIDSSENNNDEEYYYGYNDSELYAFNVLEKEYAVVEGEEADYYFDYVFETYADITSQHQQNLVASLSSIAMMVEMEKVEEGVLLEEYGIELKLYTAGEGSLYVEMKLETEEGKAKSTLTVKDYLITAETYDAKTEDYSGKTETVIEYSANVILPSTSDYTKVEI